METPGGEPTHLDGSIPPRATADESRFRSLLAELARQDAELERAEGEFRNLARAVVTVDEEDLRALADASTLGAMPRASGAPSWRGARC